MQEHRFSFVAEGSPAAIWEIFLAQHRLGVETDKVRTEILHLGGRREQRHDPPLHVSRAYEAFNPLAGYSWRGEFTDFCQRTTTCTMRPAWLGRWANPQRRRTCRGPVNRPRPVRTPEYALPGSLRLNAERRQLVP
jgi:hypothetical protein